MQDNSPLRGVGSVVNLQSTIVSTQQSAVSLIQNMIMERLVWCGEAVARTRD